jgi:phosphoribosylformylglycinamidine cyclo-ligase
VDKSKVVDGKSIVPGDVVLGLPSTGLQTNGYSLARKLFFEIGGHKPDTYLEELGTTVGKALLATHSSFLPQIGPLLDIGLIKGLAHITGGGFLENIPRILPDGVSVDIKRGTWPEPPIFDVMRELGNVSETEMFRTFNMGIGMVIVGGEESATQLKKSFGECFEIGRIIEGSRGVLISR